MSPLHRHVERLFATANAIDQFLEDSAGELAYIDWDNLNEAAVRARAYANLVYTQDAEAFIEDELDHADRLLAETRQTVKGGVQ